MLYKRLALISVLVLTTSEIAIAGQVFSWNLSRDMMKGITHNPKGVWAFMQNTTGVDKPENYSLLADYYAPCAIETPYLKCWHVPDSLGSYPLVGITTKTFSYRGTTLIKGVPLFHPAINSPVILRWQSPINGSVNVMGRVSAFDQNCSGDGVNWFLKNNSATIIKSGHLNRCTGAAILVDNIAVIKGDSLYFSIDMNQTLHNDSTNLDILIIGQQ
jgi:hypothetical protein